MTGEVIRLPTATRRKVKQSSRVDARRAFCDANPWPGQFKWPIERQMEATARARFDLGHGDPAHVLTIVLYAALEPAQQATARRMLAVGAASGLPAFCASLERLDELADLLRRDADTVDWASRTGPAG